MGQEEPAGRTAWRSLETSTAVSDALLALYAERGGAHYDEEVTQTEHALQCAQAVASQGCSDAAIVAALLHDIGHLLDGREVRAERDRTLDGGGGRSGEVGDPDVDRHHELVGARFLANWLPDDVVEPIRLHVPAKRYLCATDAGYHGGLSAASVQSLRAQGGPMRRSEVVEFEAEAHASEAIALRRCDDGAKVVDAATAPLDEYRALIAGLVALP